MTSEKRRLSKRVLKHKTKIHYADREKKKARNKQIRYDDEITSEGSFAESDEEIPMLVRGKENECENPLQARVSATRKVIEKIKEKETEMTKVHGENDVDFVTMELYKDLEGKYGMSRVYVAEKIYESCRGMLETVNISSSKSATAIAISKSSAFVVCGYKDGCIIKYDIVTLQRLRKIKCLKRNAKEASSKQQHRPRGCVLCLSISFDDKYLVSASEDNLIYIWSADELKYINVLNGHRAYVTGLAFRHNTYQLFSCSYDRCVKIWNVDKVGFIDSLYGHESMVYSIDSLVYDRAITAGSSDYTLRLWKVPEQSQAVFNAPRGSAQSCVAMLTEQLYASGGEDGSVYLWTITKRRPIFTLKNAHGPDNCKDHSSEACLHPCSDSITSPLSISSPPSFEISAIAAVPVGDVIATGSSDGFVKMFKVNETDMTLSLLHKIPVGGHVNCLKFTQDGKSLVIATGTEQRLGRWNVFKNSEFNRIIIVHFKF